MREVAPWSSLPALAAVRRPGLTVTLVPTSLGYEVWVPRGAMDRLMRVYNAPSNAIPWADLTVALGVTLHLLGCLTPEGVDALFACGGGDALVLALRVGLDARGATGAAP